MDVQALYQSLVDFWDITSPVFLAHIFLIVSWIWIRGSSIEVTKLVEQFLNSDVFKRWEKILKKFELMSKIPFLVLFLVLFYVALLGSFLEFALVKTQTP